MTVEAWERRVRWATAVAWLGVAAMALHGAWRGRRARGRKVGRPYTELPWWLYGLVGPAYGLLVFPLWRPLPVRLGPWARAAAALGGGVLTALGVGLLVGGRLALGEHYTVSSALGAQLFTGHRLVTGGPFAIVRHPMYVGALLAGLGALLVYRTWTLLFLLAHFPVFVVRAWGEEQALAAEFGAAWEAYRRRVPGWLPRRIIPGSATGGQGGRKTDATAIASTTGGAGEPGDGAGHPGGGPGSRGVGCDRAGGR